MYERIKGFQDFYPGEMAARRAMTDVLEGTARRYGFREVGTPALERAILWTDKSGDEIVEELYAFEDRGGRHVALTPELTPTIARMVAAKGQALPKPIKWFSTRPFWRYEQVQQGRQREFYQTNLDIIGSSEPVADAEVLAWGADALTSLGLTGEDFEFRVSHRDILGGVLETYGDVDIQAAIRAVDKSEKIEDVEYLELLETAGLSPSDAEQFANLIAGDDLEAVIEFADSERVTAAVENLEAVLAAAEEFGARGVCSISLDTARGLDYYTGVVFECFDSTGDVSRSIFGGGRYDDLIEQYGGPPTPAVGVAPGHETLSLLMQRADVWPAETVSTDYYVLTVGDTLTESARIARVLRNRGHVVEMDVAGRSFGGQLEYADSINAETTVIVGERDLADGEITLKDMGTGEQVQIPVDEFPGGYDRPTYVDFSE